MQSACAVLYRHLWPVRLYNTFPHYPINGTIFEKKKKLLNIKCVFWFSLHILSRIPHSKNNSARHNNNNNIYYLRLGRHPVAGGTPGGNCSSVLMLSTRYSCQILMKIEFCRQIFEKNSYTEFHENPSSGSRVVPCRLKDGRTDTKLIVALKKTECCRQYHWRLSTESMGEPGDFPFIGFQVVTSLTNEALYMLVFYVLMGGNTFWDKTHKTDCRSAYGTQETVQWSATYGQHRWYYDQHTQLGALWL